MTKTQELLARVASGTHRIDDCGNVTRWVASRQEWVTCESYRRDVVMRARIALHSFRALVKAGFKV
jgi:hypothetical protein